jgi:hypothetical protein
MPDFSHVIPESHQNLSPGFLEALIQTQREELFTGLMRLNHLSGENFTFSFLEGTQKKLYRSTNGTVDVIPRQSWLEALGRDSASVGILRLSIEGMRFARVMHEAPVHQVEESTFTAEGLATAAGKWAVEQKPGIVHVRGEGFNRYYLIAGDSTPIIEELSVWGGEARFSLNDASFPKTLPSLDYQVVRYVSVHDHDVWREYELRLAFHPFMRMLLNRFSELTGRVLTERLCEQISLWAREGGWKITLTSNGIVNRQYFDSVESAIGFYVELMRRFNGEASPALGPRMTEGISQEILMKLDSYRYELLTKSIFSWLGAGGGTGGVWR